MILLSFDLEEFDTPEDFGHKIGFEQQLKVSSEGTMRILDLLERYRDVKATFYSTAVFAQNHPEIIHSVVSKGHEIASHGHYHSSFCDDHLASSKQILEQITGSPVQGFRMARMMDVSASCIHRAGYKYNSSINPTFIPGRYNNLDKPRTHFQEEGLIQLPTSVSPFFRFPLFWLSMHNLPLGIYLDLCRRTIRKDSYLNVYFHPWEFAEISDGKYGLPGYILRNSGKEMVTRLEKLILYFKKRNIGFSTTAAYLTGKYPGTF